MYTLLVFILISYQKVTSLTIQNSNVCGLRLNKILGGNEALDHAWPWMASLQFNFKHICGGTLINNEWILTAAHCKITTSISSLRVILGTNNLQDSQNLTSRRNLIKFISHENYDAMTRENDIALIKLNNPIQLNSNLIPVCVPLDSDTHDYSSKRCYSTGWGHTYLDGQTVDKLREVKLPLYDTSLCKKLYDEMREDSQICAGERGVLKDTCQGDSGGPLVCYESDSSRWFIIGIVSYGKGCQDIGVYTKVSFFKKWIDSVIRNN